MKRKNIGGVISSLKNHGYNNIIYVDDGSSDRSLQIASYHGVTVLHHLINCGQGCALRTGINHALERGAEIIVTF